MKKCIALLLILLLSMTGIAAIAEAGFSSYTDAELRTARLQPDSEIKAAVPMPKRRRLYALPSSSTCRNWDVP